MVKWKRETAGVYSANVAGVEFNMVHQPEVGPGYRWAAESPDQSVPTVYGDTMAEVTRGVTRWAERRTAR